MPRLLFLISVLALAVAFAVRWWYGLRVLATEGERPCRCDLNKWLPAPGDTATIHRSDATAYEFGHQLRLKALAEWAEEMPKAAAAREKSRRFGLAVPPLSILIAVFAVIAVKIHFFAAIVLVLAAIALSAGFAISAVSSELQAITRASKKARDARAFPDHTQENAIIRCAHAHAWREAFPPIFKLIQG
ncbi:MAG: hypothetical protein QM680_04870 [Luteolibacter sp.]